MEATKPLAQAGTKRLGVKGKADTIPKMKDGAIGNEWMKSIERHRRQIPVDGLK
jgi:hypothetical protein